MAARFIDLHMHTYYSDGVCSPSQVLNHVRKAGVVAFSVTDHDTLDGYRAVREILGDGDPELIPGLELSAMHEGVDLHLLAYLFDPDNGDLNGALAEFRVRRNQRAIQMVERLNELGIAITIDQVAGRAGRAAIGRPHVAQTMHEEKCVPTYQAAFDQYIGNGKPAYIPKRNFTPPEAIDAVHRAGGVVVLAHPQIDETHRFLDMLTGLGLDGIEIYHSAHQARHTEQFRHLADRFRLACSGGSDFHGREGRRAAIGSQRVPEECLLGLKQRVQSRKENQ